MIKKKARHLPKQKMMAHRWSMVAKIRENEIEKET